MNEIKVGQRWIYDYRSEKMIAEVVKCNGYYEQTTCIVVQYFKGEYKPGIEYRFSLRNHSIWKYLDGQDKAW